MSSGMRTDHGTHINKPCCAYEIWRTCASQANHGTCVHEPCHEIIFRRISSRNLSLENAQNFPPCVVTGWWRAAASARCASPPRAHSSLHREIWVCGFGRFRGWNICFSGICDMCAMTSLACVTCLIHLWDDSYMRAIICVCCTPHTCTPHTCMLIHAHLIHACMYEVCMHVWWGVHAHTVPQHAC